MIKRHQPMIQHANFQPRGDNNFTPPRYQQTHTSIQSDQVQEEKVLFFLHGKATEIYRCYFKASPEYVIFLYHISKGRAHSKAHRAFPQTRLDFLKVARFSLNRALTIALLSKVQDSASRSLGSTCKQV